MYIRIYLQLSLKKHIFTFDTSSWAVPEFVSFPITLPELIFSITYLRSQFNFSFSNK